MTGAPDWPVDHLRAVGRTYRAARGRGLDQLQSVDKAEAAYLAAGGPALDARATVLAIVAHLAREHGDWLFGPAQEWVERHGTREPTHGDLFDPPESIA
ncbi:hypothetical protein SAMN02745194_03162 [Roseomonas rosea]|uniref:Uncharacterized protein n=1 Tax=Muricoccus roseus TaxID=198092 RepID=A0A1M6LG13_9PROT|nr:hypothetical protein [Roseomonas rosea]SHJ70112.1 hypothetical protein SAMN02745194_03162 [Roseomonas rosea]